MMPRVSSCGLTSESNQILLVSAQVSSIVKISLIYFNAGGGHRASALAIQSELSRQHPDWEIVLVDLFRVLDPRQIFRRMTGFAPEAYYNKRLSTGLTLGLSHELKLLQVMIRMSNRQLVARLTDYWHQMKPTMVVSLVPNFNRALGESLQRFSAETPFVTIMTDLADYPPHFWVERGYTQHLICGTQHAVSQAISQGVQQDRIHHTSGMVLSPRFYDKEDLDRAQARRSAGLDPDAKIGLVMFGGHGSAIMKRIATALVDRPLILMCGRNESLLQTLSDLPAQAQRKIVGFTDDVAHWMRLADYFIGKPGPGSISEALHCGLPVIVMRNAWTLPQERWNTEWVVENDLGRVISSIAKIDKAVDEVTNNLEHLCANVARLSNRALFEIPEIIEKIHVNSRQQDVGVNINNAC